MDKQTILAGLAQELKRGTIVLCTLDRLQTPMYGYALVTELNDFGIEVDTNTLYPLLRRLEGQGLLESSWETGAAKPRKYYSDTPLGLAVYGELKALWRQATENMDRMMDNNGGNDNEQH